MSVALLTELGARTCRALKLENEGKPEWRIIAIALRQYDHWSLSPSRDDRGQ
jgi:hypothetical protein